MKHLKSFTHLKFNSSPLKSYRNPIGKDRLATIDFSGAMLNFRGVCIYKHDAKMVEVFEYPLKFKLSQIVFLLGISGGG